MFTFPDLDDVSRGYMLEEAERDGANATEYFGRRLTPTGHSDWPDLIRNAIRSGTPETLAGELRQAGRMKTKEISHRNGVPYEKSVGKNAAELLAEGEFNRYYCRAICVRALAEGRRVFVCRGRASANPRPESEEWIGREVDADALLDDLRNNTGREPEMGLPLVNSGLTVALSRDD